MKEDKIVFEKSSGNVFDDLGIKAPDGLLELCGACDTWHEVGEKCGISDYEALRKERDELKDERTVMLPDLIATKEECAEIFIKLKEVEDLVRELFDLTDRGISVSHNQPLLDKLYKLLNIDKEE